MARSKSRPGSNPPDEPAYLTHAIAEVDAELKDRIGEGHALLAEVRKPIASLERIRELKAEFRDWRRYNSTYLERRFTNTSLQHSYNIIGLGVVSVGYREVPERMLQELDEDLVDDINWLSSLRKRLHLYERPAAGTSTAPAEPAKDTPAKTEYKINVTFQGQVGQVNLNEMVERIHNEVKVVNKRGEVDLAAALSKLGDGLREAEELDDDRRAEVLDAVSVLAEVGSQPPEQRGKFIGRIKGAVIVLQEAAKAAPAVQKLLEQFGPTIQEHLPHIQF
jgi:hypothetical protein